MLIHDDFFLEVDLVNPNPSAGQRWGFLCLANLLIFTFQGFSQPEYNFAAEAASILSCLFFKELSHHHNYTNANYLLFCAFHEASSVI
jgi:hypothetical protein